MVRDGRSGMDRQGCQPVGFSFSVKVFPETALAISGGAVGSWGAGLANDATSAFNAATLFLGILRAMSPIANAGQQIIGEPKQQCVIGIPGDKR